MDTTPWSTAIAAEAIANRSCFQHPQELAQLLAHLDAYVKPDVVLEIGGGQGGSAWAWGQLPTVKEVITVTLPEAGRRWLCCPMTTRHWVYLGDSTHSDTVHALNYHLDGRRPDFIWIDGDHSYQTAVRDWVTYSPLIFPGGLVGLHDILPETRWPSFEVDQLWAEIKASNVTEELIGDPAQGMGTGLVYPGRPA